MDISTIEELVDLVKDQSILSGEINDDGLHIYLSNGNILLIIGALAVCLLEEQTGTLQ